MTPTPPAPTPSDPAAPTQAPLAMTPDAFRRLAHAAVDLVADHLDGIRDRPVFAPMTPAERAALLERPLPDGGASPETLARPSSGARSSGTPWGTGIRGSSAG